MCPIGALVEWNVEHENEWQELDLELAGKLGPARIASHWATQIPASLSTLLDGNPGNSHTDLLWNSRNHIFQSHPLVLSTSTRPLRAGLRISSLSVSLSIADIVDDEYLVRGRRLQSAQQWLCDVLEDHGMTDKIERPAHDLPASPISSGGVVEADGTALAALEQWFSNAFVVLVPIQLRIASTEIRLSSRSFELTTHLSVDDSDSASPSTIDLGFSPGDSTEDAPCFFASLTSASPAPSLPLPKVSLPSNGQWHANSRAGQQGISAVLRARELPSGAVPQRRAVEDFLGAALEHLVSMTNP